MTGNCELCGKSCKYIGQHVRYTHPKISAQTYYNRFVLKGDAPTCARDGCDNICKFFNLNRGYTNYCGNVCSAIVRMANPVLKAKMLDMYKDEEFARKRSEHSRRIALQFKPFEKFWGNPKSRIAHIDRLKKLTTQRNNDPNSGIGFRNVWKNESSRVLMEKNSGSRGRKGNHISEKTSGEIHFASSWELRAYILLDSDSSVVAYERGPRIEYVYEDKSVAYIVDLIVYYVSNQKRLIEIKGDHMKFSIRNKAKYKAGCEYSKENRYLPFKVWDSGYVLQDKILRKNYQRFE